MRAKDIMTTRVVTVVEDTPVDEIAGTLLQHRISAVPVIDSDDQLVGIVSEGDLIGRPDAEGRDNSWWLSGILSTEERAQKYAKAHGLLAKRCDDHVRHHGGRRRDLRQARWPFGGTRDQARAHRS